MKYYDFGDGQGFVPAQEHPNGGGMVALTACVEPTVFVDKWAVVFGFARVKDRVRICGRARVSGAQLPGGLSTLIEDDVVLCGNVTIQDCVLLQDNVIVRDNVKITGSAQIHHRAELSGDAQVHGDVKILDNAYISGPVRIYGHERQIIIGGEEVICCDGEIRTPADVKKARKASSTRRRPAAQRDSADVENLPAKRKAHADLDDDDLPDIPESVAPARAGHRIAA